MKASRPPLDKELGQHFLTNKGVVEKILQRVRSFPHRELIEIGPGGGALTEHLLAEGLRIVAIEFDERWYTELKTKFAAQIATGQLQLILDDATRIDLLLVKKYLQSGSVTLCGNLPYNRGQEIVLRFFEHAAYVDAFVVMLQREVALKFLPKNDRKYYGPLSIKMHFLADQVDLFSVSPGSFAPPPKVESAVLSFRRKSHELDPGKNPAGYKYFSDLVRRAFHQRRKKLSNNLARDEFVGDLSAFAAKRAEELSPDDFLKFLKAKSG